MTLKSHPSIMGRLL